jgi:hypothetical protein
MSLRVGFERLPEVSEFNAYLINYLIFIVILFSANPLRKTPGAGIQIKMLMPPLKKKINLKMHSDEKAMDTFGLDLFADDWFVFV